MKIYQHYIDGQYVDPINGQWIDSFDPYRGTAWAQIPKGCAQDADRAVEPRTGPCVRAHGRG